MSPRVPWLWLVVACVALAVPFLVVDIAPSGDGPQHLLAARGVAANDDATLGYADFVEPHASLTGSAFCELLIPLLMVLPWRVAYAAGSVLSLWLWLASVTAVGYALRRPALGVFVGVISANSWCFFVGLVSYSIGVAIGLLATALVLTTPRWSARATLSLSVLLLACAHAHIFAVVLVGPLVLAIAAVRDGRRGVAAAVIAGVPAFLLVAVAVASGGNGTGAWVFSEPLERVFIVAWGYLGGPWWRTVPTVLAAAAGVVAGLRGERSTRVLAGGALAAIGLSWALPLDVPGWQFVSPRLPLLGMTLALLLVPAWFGRRAHTALCVAFAAASLVWVVSFHLRFERAAAELLAHLDDPPGRPGVRLPVVLAPPDMRPGADVAHVNPFFNLGHLFAVSQGGWTAFSFANLPVHVVHARPRVPPEPDRSTLVTRLWRYGEAERTAAFTDLMSNARRYDEVIAFEDDTDHARWFERGFVAMQRDGRFARLRFEGCRVTLLLPVGATTVYNGLTPHGTRGAERKQRTSGADAVQVQAAACGPIWLRLADDAGRSVPCVGKAVVEVVANAARPLVIDCRTQHEFGRFAPE
jgi:hypothetical protein